MRNKLVSKSIPFSAFFADYYMKNLKLYKKDRFGFIILSKNHVGRDRLGIFEEEVWSIRDFAERLSLQFNGQTQQEYFGGGTTVSLEGVAIKFVKVPLMMSLLQTFTPSFPTASNKIVQWCTIIFRSF